MADIEAFISAIVISKAGWQCGGWLGGAVACLARSCKPCGRLMMCRDLHAAPLLLPQLVFQTESEFAKSYAAGIHKSRYWEPFYEDTLNLLAKLPTIAAMIYRRTYKGGKYIEAGKLYSCAGAVAECTSRCGQVLLRSYFLLLVRPA